MHFRYLPSSNRSLSVIKNSKKRKKDFLAKVTIRAVWDNENAFLLHQYLCVSLDDLYAPRQRLFFAKKLGLADANANRTKGSTYY